MLMRSRSPIALVCSIPSDSHSWNLVYLQLLLQEKGFATQNLGPCTPLEELARWCALEPDVVVVSSVNGHARTEAPQVAAAVRAALPGQDVQLVIGGMLGTSPDDSAVIEAELTAAGFDGVYTGAEAVARFTATLCVQDTAAGGGARVA
ncbi:cobalamin-dependent protein [Streptomyces sp. NPDC005500]|uniref:cobalamin B12-binding domain-containing protein n=1 Tax=Streptomyces sp. NPDC005500 TaxID=3155007 RepID=UPI0033A23F92